MTDSATGVKTTYYYDFADRMMKYVESGTNYSHSVGYAYDEINNLTSLVETINGVKHTTSYTYDNDNRVTSVTNGSASETYTYDGYSRVSQKVTKNGTATVLTDTFTYRTPTTGTTSGQVSTLKLAASGLNRTYTYAYDNNGNILSVSDGTNTTSYVYDSAGQLLRENNQAAGKTWVWTYDNAGNILTRKEYAYTTGTLGTVVDTVTYNYDNTNWGDLLISYDGRTITYEPNGENGTMGNPLNDGRWTYTWEHGRQLASITDGNTTVDYVYNADGLRTQKTVTTSNSHTHVFQNTVVAPTCTENGHTRHVCSCGYIYQDTPVAATGHTYTTSVVADTCTTNGYTLYTCSCGYSYQDGAPGHTFTTLVVAPTETVNGFTKHECECGYSYQSAPVASLASGASSGESGTTEVAVYDYVYNGSSLTQLTVTSGEDDAETLYFAYDGSSPMSVTYNGTNYYYATNLQGDVVAILNSSGTAVVQYTYDAWGNILTTTGSMASTLGAVNPLTYRGYVFDRETGLYYLQSRYYNPEIGRFINADAFATTGQGFIGNNMFAYCLNNPVIGVDSFGYFSNLSPIMTPEQIGDEKKCWTDEVLTSDHFTQDDSLTAKLRKIVKSFFYNIELSAGTGLGLGYGYSVCKLLGIDAGIYYDVFHISYSHGEWSIQDYAYKGFTLTFFFYEIGESAEQYRNYSDMPCEPTIPVPSESVSWPIYSWGAYFFGGGAVSVAFDIESFLKEFGQIFFNES